MSNADNQQQEAGTSKDGDKKRDSKKRDSKNRESLRKSEEYKRKNSEKRRNSSSDQILRYKIPKRISSGPQQSRSIRNLVPLKPIPEKQPEVRRIRILFDEPSTSSDRDHHDAVEFYNRSTAYHYTRESLLNLRGPERKRNGRKDRTQSDDSSSSKRSTHHVRRCVGCFQVKDHCICDTDGVHHRPAQSDWMVMVKPVIDEPKVFTTPRLTWLQNLEETSKVDKPKLVEKSFKGRELCCFPFSTFNIFMKQKVSEVDYYLKN